MNEKKYTITLSDGTKIENLRMNGTCFVSETVIDPNIFYGKLGTIIINDGEKDVVHNNMKYVETAQIEEDTFWFALVDIPKEVLERDRLRADVDFIAMMTDVNI